MGVGVLIMSHSTFRTHWTIRTKQWAASSPNIFILLCSNLLKLFRCRDPKIDFVQYGTTKIRAYNRLQRWWHWHCPCKDVSLSGSPRTATARDVSKMASLRDISSVTLLALDVTSSTSITAAVESIKAEGDGTLDYLVNNAAINQSYPALDVDVNVAKNVFDTNYWGALEVIQKLCPLLIASKGTIVSISSISAHANIPYCSKSLLSHNLHSSKSKRRCRGCLQTLSGGSNGCFKD